MWAPLFGGHPVPGSGSAVPACFALLAPVSRAVLDAEELTLRKLCPQIGSRVAATARDGEGLARRIYVVPVEVLCHRAVKGVRSTLRA
jgi:hypothetical protein